MEKKWTTSQIHAIQKKNANILVSAAAGSRKDICFNRKNNK